MCVRAWTPYYSISPIKSCEQREEGPMEALPPRFQAERQVGIHDRL